MLAMNLWGLIAAIFDFPSYTAAYLVPWILFSWLYFKRSKPPLVQVVALATVAPFISAIYLATYAIFFHQSLPNDFESMTLVVLGRLWISVLVGMVVAWALLYSKEVRPHINVLQESLLIVWEGHFVVAHFIMLILILAAFLDGSSNLHLYCLTILILLAVMFILLVVTRSIKGLSQQISYRKLIFVGMTTSIVITSLVAAINWPFRHP